MQESDIEKTHRIAMLLRQRHDGREWAYFDELRTKTGYGYGDSSYGYIDGFAFGLWNKNKLAIAYEIKVSRQDFQKDIATFTEKQKDALRNSHQFYYVCPQGLLEPSEVPEITGLMVADKGGLKVKKVAAIRELQDKSMTMDFIRALMRRSSESMSTIRANVLYKYSGKELNEEDLLHIAKQKGLSNDELIINQRVAAKLKEREEGTYLALKELQRACGFWSNGKEPYTEGSLLDIVNSMKDHKNSINVLKNLKINVEYLKRSFENFKGNVTSIGSSIELLEKQMEIEENVGAINYDNNPNHGK